MRESRYLGNKDTNDDFLAFLNRFTEAALSTCDAAIINIQQLANNKKTVIEWLAAQAYRFIDLAIWDKETAPPQMARGVLNSQHELLVILSAKNNPSRVIPFADWHGNISTIYRGGAQRNNDAAALHAATMPMHLPLWVIEKLCPLAKTIYEPFAGSGTTLIAAEQLKKTCVAVEISEVYSAVILERFETMTKETPVRWVD